MLPDRVFRVGNQSSDCGPTASTVHHPAGVLARPAVSAGDDFLGAFLRTCGPPPRGWPGAMVTVPGKPGGPFRSAVLVHEAKPPWS